MSNNKSDTAPTRHFYVMTIGRKPCDNLAYYSIYIETKSGEFPTHKMCVDRTKEMFNNVSDVAVMAISEMSHNDWKVFISEI